MNKLSISLFLFLISYSINWANQIPLRNTISYKTKVPEEKLESSIRLPWGMFVYLISSYQYSTWIPLKSDSADSPIIEYKTTGFHQIRLNGGLGLRGEDFIDFIYEGPLTNSPKQRAMFEANVDREQGVEKYTGSLMLRPVYHYLKRNNKSTLSKVINWMFTFRFRYSKELYFGSIKSAKDFYYVPFGTDFDIDRFDELNLPLVNNGHPYSFKSQFVDIDYSVSLGVFDDESKRKHDLRLGYIHSKFSRPSDYYRLYTDSNVPILFETEYSSKAIWVGIEQVNTLAGELNYNARFVYGAFEHKVRNADILINDYTEEKEGKSPYYFAFDASGWANKSFYETKYGSLLVTFGGDFHIRTWMVGVFAKNENDETTYLDTDIIIKIFAGLSYRF